MDKSYACHVFDLFLTKIMELGRTLFVLSARQLYFSIPLVPIYRLFLKIKMARAIWNGQVIAESDDTVVVEGNHYFPEESVRKEFLIPSEFHTVCPWKGTASYHHIQVDGKRNENAAWYYPQPKDMAKMVKGRIAFWRGVEVEE